MTKDLWPEDETWPGEQLGEAFGRQASGKGEIRIIEQKEGESAEAFQVRKAKAQASAQEALWICIVDESEGRGRRGGPH